jgi:hypothetical protein
MGTFYLSIYRAAAIRYEKAMPRNARIDAPGALHHIIIRGIERKAIFKDRLDRRNFLNRLDRIVSETETGCYRPENDHLWGVRTTIQAGKRSNVDLVSYAGQVCYRKGGRTDK